MIELALAIVMIVAVGRIASADNQNTLLWSLVAFGLCFACLFIPIPYLRILLAGILSYVAMVIYKIAANK